MPVLLTARPASDVAEESKVRKMAGARHAPGDWILRARIIVLSWDGLRAAVIAVRLGCHDKTVRKWLHRFNTQGLDGLGDRPGCGRKRRITEDERSRIIALVKLTPPGRLEIQPSNELWAAARQATCPDCGSLSGRIHGSYLRFPRDLPTAGKSVVVALRVRRFVCAESSCPRKTFVEQVPGLTRRFGRRTERLRSTLISVALALAGRAGARMTDVFRAPASRNTLLRLISSIPEPPIAAPRVVGVDEYAQCTGQVYGTVLVDVETRRPIDLLPDREAGTLAAWLAKRPGIEIVCRDRAPFFADGATRGAPQAIQVADRWHLWHNLAEAAEKCVHRHRGCLRPTPEQPEEPQEEVESAASSPWPAGHRFAERIRSKHATIHALLAAGHSKRSVARQLGMTLNTILRFSRATTPDEMFTGQWQNRPTRLDAYKPYLDQRWQEGCTNAWKLWEEIKEQGYPRGYAGVRAYVSRNLRGKPQPVGARPPSARAVTRWLLTHPDALPESDRIQLKAVVANCPELTALSEHVRSFGHMVAHLQGHQLPTWIEAATATTDLPSLRHFAQHLERDLDAVTAGLTLPWNSGVVEGHVNRIKMLKRQMFGRAGFELLRNRVLLYA